MSKQIDINDLVPSALQKICRDTIDAEYQARIHDGELPPIRTRYEAYGKMAEHNQNVKAAMDAVNAGMKSCLNTLAGGDGAFSTASDALYTSLLGAMTATAEMLTQVLNIIYRMEDVIRENPTPLEEMAEQAPIPEAGEDIPDEEEDEDNGNN